MIKVYRGNEWIEDQPTGGELIRKYDSAGGFVQDFYDLPKEIKKNKIVITSHDKRAIVMKGNEITVDIEIHDGDGLLLSGFSDSFAMPVGRVGYGNYATILLPFVNGKCSRSYTWPDAGEYEITKEMINMHLDESEKLDFDGFNITVAG